MQSNRNGAKKGFTLVELLAVVLVLSVLAAIAIPAYLNTRKTSAARACSANIAALASAESNYSTRFGKFNGATTADTSWAAAYVASTATGSAPTGGLIGAPEGLTAKPVCPLSGLDYTIAVTAGTSGAPDTCLIVCPSADQHSKDITDGSDTSKNVNWKKTLSGGGADKSNPF